MENIFLFSVFIDSFPVLLSRLHITLFIVAAAVLFGMVAALAIAVVRLANIPVLSQLAIVYISVIRGIPLLVLLFVVYIGLPVLVEQLGYNINRWDPLFFVIVTYILNTAAFLAEVIRSAILGVDAGQKEAAYAVGMTRFQTFIRIIAPQALQISIPAMGNTVVGLLKNTSLAYTLGVLDVIGIIQVMGSRSHRMLEAYTAAAVIFFVLSYILEVAFRRLEQSVGGVHAQRN